MFVCAHDNYHLGLIRCWSGTISAAGEIKLSPVEGSVIIIIIKVFTGSLPCNQDLARDPSWYRSYSGLLGQGGVPLYYTGSRVGVSTCCYQLWSHTGHNDVFLQMRLGVWNVKCRENCYSFWPRLLINWRSITLLPVLVLFLWVCSGPPHFGSGQIIFGYISCTSVLVYTIGGVLNLFVCLKEP